jgi:hypothetical protein
MPSIQSNAEFAAVLANAFLLHSVVVYHKFLGGILEPVQSRHFTEMVQPD